VGYSGLEKKTEETLAKIWSWDYMSAAQFEDGIAQRVLKMILEYTKAGDFAAGTCKLDNKKEAYYLCKKEEQQEVEQIIRHLYLNERVYEHLLEPAWVRESFNDEDYHEKTAGWLEENNGFMFFKDKKMYEQTLELFGIK